MLPVDSKLSLWGVFLHTVTQLGSREKGMAAERGFVRSGNLGGVGRASRQPAARRRERFQSSESESAEL